MALINWLDTPLLRMERAFLDSMEDLDLRLGQRLGSANGTFAPKIDISEDKDNFYVLAELPGLEEKDVKVTVDEDVLTITGRKEREEEDKKRNYYRIERSFGEFVRSLTLPPNVQSKNISATFKDGVLELTMPKVASAAPTAREIPLSTEKRVTHNGQKRVPA